MDGAIVHDVNFQFQRLVVLTGYFFEISKNYFLYEEGLVNVLAYFFFDKTELGKS